jgi:hypothetical protein
MCRAFRGEATAMIAAEKVVEPKNIAMLYALKVRKVKVGILLPGLRSNLDTANFVQCRDSISCFLRAYPELDSSPFGSR